MNKRLTKIRLRIFLILLGVSLSFVSTATDSRAGESSAAHNLQIELVPTQMKLIGRDDITVKTDDRKMLVFRISENLTQIRVIVGNEPRSFEVDSGRLLLDLRPHEQSAELQLQISYNGIFDDPVPVQPVNTDNPGYGVTGTISPKGTFLLAGAGWYPELINSRATYRIKIEAPAGTVAVTAGRSRGHSTENGKTISTWQVDHPVRGLALSAARYVFQEKKVGTVTAATYLMPQNQHLAASYLRATAGYLGLYSDLFGAYPFQKFAVVENFFPTGFGFPSYTLMGGTVLRLPFIIHTSLGHEIAHCWWGNGVYVDYADGNWSEGLTAYVADYLFKEMKSKKAALDARRQWLRNYATLVRPENDFALSRFRSRHNPVTKTIGYDKSAMIFHMIRQLIGEEAFWGSLRDLYRDRLFRQTSWADLQQAFEKRGQRSLQNFFDQWVYRKGAPQVSLKAVSTTQNSDGWQVSGKITQDSPFYDFALRLALETERQIITKTIDVSGQETAFILHSAAPPLKLTADPADDIFRRLYPSEIPPAVNALKSSPSVVTVLADRLDPALQKAARRLALSLGLKHNQFISESELDRQTLIENDVLLIGRPRYAGFLKNLPAAIDIRTKSFALENEVYDSSSDAFFGVFNHPYAGNRIAALFMPLSPKYADIVAAKVTHYGKYSYLTFRSGKNQAKGFWPVEASPLVYTWPGAKNDGLRDEG
ncbi:PDZ domain [Olavius algarvensis Delta 1 endosymbiont]|nr:PDZ domain [Olavius algarvensis Delta 1 endosymbiont]